MQSTNPKDILITLHLVRAGLVCDLLTKEEVIDWAYNIITKDEQPDIFFIDLALSSSKSKNDIIYHFSDYLNFENPSVQGRPLLGLLYKQYQSGLLNLEQTIRTLFKLKSEVILTSTEQGFISSIDNSFDLAQHNLYGSMDDVRKETEHFLGFYKDYSLDNFDKWCDLDIQVEQIIDNEIKKQEIEYELLQASSVYRKKKPWWKF